MKELITHRESWPSIQLEVRQEQKTLAVMSPKTLQSPSPGKTWLHPRPPPTPQMPQGLLLGPECMLLLPQPARLPPPPEEQIHSRAPREPASRREERLGQSPPGLALAWECGHLADRLLTDCPSATAPSPSLCKPHSAWACPSPHSDLKCHLLPRTPAETAQIQQAFST